MKTEIIVKCSCGKEWSDIEDVKTASYWWRVLDAVEPEYSIRMKEKGDKKTVEMALRLLWARHQASKQERGDKKSHEATVTQQITIENLEDATALKKSEGK